VFEIPFVVCADPISRSIVIAIRGSASMRDIVTDLCSAADQAILNHLDIDNTIINQQPNVVDICVQSSCGSAHRGMLKSAEYVYETLMRQNILQDMFVLYPNYQLIVTGHSLGGGVAALLGLILRYVGDCLYIIE
jgi:sn1-specific diacylglycerol lipase